MALLETLSLARRRARAVCVVVYSCSIDRTGALGRGPDAGMAVYS
eukprot:COSAG06_NODE_42939_length_377_cov_0.553957_1_plen_44_part_10